MADEIEVQAEVAASPSDLYAMVSDVERMGEWSPENVSCRWADGASGPTVGARFSGRNRRGWRRWSTVNEVVEADPGRVFAFRTSSMGLPVARWRYTFAGDEPDGPCTVTETWVDERGALIRVAGRLATGVADRASHNRDGMRQTLEALKAAAERG
ncbi:MAG: SRPBCC family protein [Acidimicrobiales bacterium]|nr:SRPBCC family protein [Acidimicrobiales bacterium]MCB9371370.1 SRPBCC family protein [Microthrixaceae bacterium]